VSEQVTNELTLGSTLAAEVAYFVLGIESPFPPR